MESSPVLDAKSLQIARERLDAMSRTSLAQRDDRYRLWVEEATAWLDAGVYGRCSVCGRGLDAVHIAHRPEVKVCADCRLASREADRRWFCVSRGSANGSRKRGRRTRLCARLWSTRDPGEVTTEAFLRAAALWSSRNDRSTPA